ncbi:protein-methionine-sulfoxide reductase heme-binding subunit MsrQ [Ottowia sp.]|uniref:sulfite oxidase heme-binding subunit YedZ n=1 Tax=Ottowia sp. TaxID=1898956 RepID=UPI002C04D981|nr:protein-methionine-sulfoxide reductase heme-binding subunit MsrQ [Ottowia sp.]HRN74555.1 protein-methionine-sulfoxide reductase heme-binding subunit MsrQ [Ottowia sp.]HRQ01989.1 protein-methionine-sulfoxide reductase heme-binding subunit MsrQ [Ottowia sp.]
MRSLLLHPLAKPLVFLLCLLPLAWLVFGAATDQLGANPAEALTRGLGDWALRMLCLTLAVTPLRLRTRTPQLARFRRMFGLFVFFYACLHMLAYGWLDKGFDVIEISRDILERPFILDGFTTWLLLLPLALTSSNRAVRALGGRAWRSLHRLIYLIAPLALLHFFSMRSGKNDYAEVAMYAVVIGVLLLERLLRYFEPKQA